MKRLILPPSPQLIGNHYAYLIPGNHLDTIRDYAASLFCDGNVWYYKGIGLREGQQLFMYQHTFGTSRLYI